ncbi:MAG: SRPBCC family protein [Lautropia sp.]
MTSRRIVVLTMLLAGIAAAGNGREAVGAAQAATPARGVIDAGAEWQGEQMISWVEVEVAATPEQAFAVLTDYDRMAEFLPGMVHSRLLARDGAKVIVEQRVEETVLFFRQRLDVRLAIVETPPRHLTLRALSGSFRSLDGSYELAPVVALAGGTRGAAPVAADGQAAPLTRIEYRSRFVPDFDLPQMLGPYVVKRSLERHFAALKKEIDRRAAAARPPKQPGS